jgi:hypothetical protein
MLFKKLYNIKEWENISFLAKQEIFENYQDIYLRKKSLSFNILPFKFFIKLKPLIDKSFSEFNIKCKNLALYVTYSNEEGALHSDNALTNARINIPVLNCLKTYTEFYSVSKFKFYENSKFKIKLPDTDAVITFLDKFQLDCPTVMCVNEFHKIVVSENVPRISLTITFDKDPIFLLN